MNLEDYIQKHKQKFDDQKISSKADVSFEQALKNSLHKTSKSKIVYLRYFSIAASFALVLSTAIWFYIENRELKKKEQLLANLMDTSTGTRLEAVYRFNDAFKKEDHQIIKVLIKTLLEDKNANVRIATINALLKFPENEEIRQGLISALVKEKTPLVQIKLINSLSDLREQRAQEPLENIINNEETFPIVKSNATLAMSHLKQ